MSRLRGAGMLLLGLVLWTGCVSDDSSSTITVGLLKLTSSAPLFIAESQGLFKELHLDVKFQYFDAAQPIAVAAASGSLDVGATGLTAALYNLAAGGQPLTIVADKGREWPGFHLVGLVVRKALYDQDLRTLAGLKGRKVGITQIGSTFQYSLANMLEKAGLSPSSVQLVPLAGMSNLLETLSSGQVDAILVPEPHVSRAVQEGYGHVVAWVGDLFPWQTGALFFSPAFARDRARAVPFLRAYLRALARYTAVAMPEHSVDAAKKREMIALLARATGAPEAAVTASLPYIDARGELMPGDVERQIGWYQRQGLIQGQLSAKALLDNTLLSEALRLEAH